ncbi:glycosyltransferase family 2 protein [Thalassotalea sp. HSM 43]|uniref:glycosyltransferase family 2 protein n=1 Tax=Thalassotalea sp. HSM 43 TaxID=2552945 RepID=UPI001081F551|nr:glycosyltransferase family 2 protein [Thalassotalea sp. HSM 43]QBY04181.1 glycosyltransferase family 2 protein [Thalassotalea sp. HSM 43]
MTLVFFICLLLILYGYFIYPAVLYWLSQKYGEEPGSCSDYPDVAIVIAAFNEEQSIGQRIENLQQLQYPGQLHFYIGSDGSSDNTNDILAQIDDPRLQVFAFSENRGKISVLNDLMAQVEQDIVVLSDANTEFAIDAVSELVSGFVDGVGAVCGKLHLYNKQDNQNQDGMYWRYENFLKFHESRLGALLGANGAIYAMRKSLYQPLPKDTVVDDFTIVMNIKKQGYKVVYRTLASAREEVAPSLGDEFGRRVRIGLGNYKALKQCLWALAPEHGILAWCFWSHKVVRWFIPHMLVLLLFSNLFLLQHGFFQFTLLAQIVFYGVAWHAIHKLQNHNYVASLQATAAFFLLMNLALLKGFWQFCLGNKQGQWQRTARGGDS